MFFLILQAKYLLCCRHPLSSMVFGTNALVTKPAQSLAPMLVTAILASYGYQRATGSGAGALHGAMFLLACAVPVGVGVLQALVWSLYTLRHTHITTTTTTTYV
jgi:Na+/melibiose symporter-like transporter